MFLYLKHVFSYIIKLKNRRRTCYWKSTFLIKKNYYLLAQNLVCMQNAIFSKTNSCKIEKKIDFLSNLNLIHLHKLLFRN